jgi:hypothetical protein
VASHPVEALPESGSPASHAKSAVVFQLRNGRTRDYLPQGGLDLLVLLG